MSAIGLTVLAALLAIVALLFPGAGTYELLLVSMLARPMVALVLVLGTIDEEVRRPPAADRAETSPG